LTKAATVVGQTAIAGNDQQWARKREDGRARNAAACRTEERCEGAVGDVVGVRSVRTQAAFSLPVDHIPHVRPHGSRTSTDAVEPWRPLRPGLA
jgi:hypothetical protein